jgi:hypothetical protein
MTDERENNETRDRLAKFYTRQKRDVKEREKKGKTKRKTVRGMIKN